jgi:hypothetical protein
MYGSEVYCKSCGAELRESICKYCGVKSKYVFLTKEELEEMAPSLVYSFCMVPKKFSRYVLKRG